MALSASARTSSCACRRLSGNGCWSPSSSIVVAWLAEARPAALLLPLPPPRACLAAVSSSRQCGLPKPASHGSDGWRGVADEESIHAEEGGGRRMTEIELTLLGLAGKQN